MLTYTLAAGHTPHRPVGPFEDVVPRVCRISTDWPGFWQERQGCPSPLAHPAKTHAWRSSMQRKCNASARPLSSALHSYESYATVSRERRMSQTHAGVANGLSISATRSRRVSITTMIDAKTVGETSAMRPDSGAPWASTPTSSAKANIRIVKPDRGFAPLA